MANEGSSHFEEVLSAFEWRVVTHRNQRIFGEELAPGIRIERVTDAVELRRRYMTL